MTKTLRMLLVLGPVALFSYGPAWARKPAPAKIQYHWDRMSIVQVLPSQVFARLGLTHSTRYGFTRDGHTKQTPDPTFPAGLTDVVPYDATHLLLIRGTTQGLAQFRVRVLATISEITVGARWHVTSQLLPGVEGEGLGPVVPQDVPTDLPFTVTVGPQDNPHVYRLKLHANANGTTAVTCQTNLSPPMGETQAILPVSQVWAPAVTLPLLPSGAVVFDDRASDRQAARQRLAMPEITDTGDYQLRVIVEAPKTVAPPTETLPAPAPITPAPIDPAAMPPPSPREEPNTPPQ